MWRSARHEAADPWARPLTIQARRFSHGRSTCCVQLRFNSAATTLRLNMYIEQLKAWNNPLVLVGSAWKEHEASPRVCLVFSERTLRRGASPLDASQP